MLPSVQRAHSVFQVVPVTSVPVTRHQAPHSLFFSPSLQMGAFFRMKSPSSFSFSSQERCFNLFNNFVAICWTISALSMSLFYWGAQNWTQESSCGLSSSDVGMMLEKQTTALFVFSLQHYKRDNICRNTLILMHISDFLTNHQGIQKEVTTTALFLSLLQSYTHPRFCKSSLALSEFAPLLSAKAILFTACKPQ